jgi:hypothetical protein
MHQRDSKKFSTLQNGMITQLSRNCIGSVVPGSLVTLRLGLDDISCHCGGLIAEITRYVTRRRRSKHYLL